VNDKQHCTSFAGGHRDESDDHPPPALSSVHDPGICKSRTANQRCRVSPFAENSLRSVMVGQLLTSWPTIYKSFFLLLFMIYQNGSHGP